MYINIVIFILCTGIQGSKALPCCSSAKPAESTSKVMVSKCTIVETRPCCQLRCLVGLKCSSGSVTVKTEAGKLASRLTDCAEFIAKLIKFIEKTFRYTNENMYVFILILLVLFVAVKFTRGC